MGGIRNRVSFLFVSFLLMGSGWLPRQGVGPDEAHVASGGSVLVDVLANDGALGVGLKLVQLGALPRMGDFSIEDNQVRFVAPEVEVDTVVSFGYIVENDAGRRGLGQVRITVHAPLPALVLRGHVVGARAGCGVIVRIGPREFPGCADGEGRFEVEVRGGLRTEAVNIHATLPGHLGRVETWASQAMTYGDLLEHAPPSGIVDEPLFAPLRLTPLTTVHALDIQRANGGVPVEHVDDLDRLDALSDATRVWQHGAILHALHEGSLDLPVHYESAHAFLLDRIAFRDFVREQPIDIHTAARHVLAAATGLHATFAPDVGAERWVATWTLVPNAIEIQSYGGLAIDLGADGTGILIDRTSTAGDTLHWWPESGGLGFAQEAPWLGSIRHVIVCPDGRRIEDVDVETRYERLWRMVQTRSRDLSVLVSHSVVMGDIPEPGEGCHAVGEPALEWVGYAPRSLRAPAPTAMPVGVWHLSVQSPGWQNGPVGSRGVGTLDFTTRTLQAEGYEPRFTVRRVDPATLRLTLRELQEHGGRTIEVDVNRLDSDGVGGEEWVTRWRSSDGHYKADVGLAIQAQDVHGFPEAPAAAGLWLSGFSIAQADTALDALQRFHIHLPDTLLDPGAQITTGQQASSYAMPFSWDVAQGSVVMTTYARMGAPTPPRYAECPQGHQCYIHHRRTWRLLAEGTLPDGTRRVYLAEEIHVGNSQNDELAPLSMRVNYYDARGTLEFPMQHRARMRLLP